MHRHPEFCSEVAIIEVQDSLNTISFRYLQRKKSHGVKSGEGASQSKGPRLPIQQPGNIIRVL